MDEELIPANPVIGVTKRLQLERDKRVTVEPLTIKETVLFLETCQGCQPDYFPFFLTAFRTGMGLGVGD